MCDVDMDQDSKSPTEWDMLPFIEKYRPSTLEDVISHHELLQSVKNMGMGSSLQNMVFYGPPGTGKTSTALVLCNIIYGKAKSRMVLSLNASDDRGIDMIRSKVKEFCEMGITDFHMDQATLDAVKDLPKLILLDEADMMTKSAQLALRRIMEDYSQHARFLIVCNYINKIVPAVQSRCVVFRLNMLSNDEVSQCVRRVCRKENIEISTDAEQALAVLGKGDLRKVLGLLQSAARLGEEKVDYGGDGKVRKTIVIGEKDVYMFASEPLKADIQEIAKVLLTLPFRQALEKTKSTMAKKHYGLKSIVELLYKEVCGWALPFHVRAELVTGLADLEVRLAIGCDEALQVPHLISTFFKARAYGERIWNFKELQSAEIKRLEGLTQEERQRELQEFQKKLFADEEGTQADNADGKNDEGQKDKNDKKDVFASKDVDMDTSNSPAMSPKNLSVHLESAEKVFDSQPGIAFGVPNIANSAGRGGVFGESPQPFGAVASPAPFGRPGNSQSQARASPRSSMGGRSQLLESITKNFLMSSGGKANQLLGGGNGVEDAVDRIRTGGKIDRKDMPIRERRLSYGAMDQSQEPAWAGEDRIKMESQQSFLDSGKKDKKDAMMLD